MVNLPDAHLQVGTRSIKEVSNCVNAQAQACPIEQMLLFGVISVSSDPVSEAAVPLSVDGEKGWITIWGNVGLLTELPCVGDCNPLSSAEKQMICRLCRLATLEHTAS